MIISQVVYKDTKNQKSCSALKIDKRLYYLSFDYALDAYDI